MTTRLNDSVIHWYHDEHGNLVNMLVPITDVEELKKLISKAESILLDATAGNVASEPGLVSWADFAHYTSSRPPPTYYVPKQPHPLYPEESERDPHKEIARYREAESHDIGLSLRTYGERGEALHPHILAAAFDPATWASPGAASRGGELGQSGGLRYQCSRCSRKIVTGDHYRKVGNFWHCLCDYGQVIKSSDCTTEQHAPPAVPGLQPTDGHPLGEGPLPVRVKP